MTIFYTGVGSRKVPLYFSLWFTKLARVLDQHYTLRSGGADGCDIAFENGATNKEIYLPWKGFNNNTSPLYDVCDDAKYMARWIHPLGKKLDGPALLLHARNCYQVLGKNLDTPSEFLICWTPNGETVGGTATAIKLATFYGVEVINLGKQK